MGVERVEDPSRSPEAEPLVGARGNAPRFPLNCTKKASPTGIAVVTLLPFTPLAAPLGLCALPPVYFAYLALIVLGYMVLATLMKKLYIRKYHELL